MSTTVPGAARVPAAGRWLTTIPGGALAVRCRVTVPSCKPSCSSPRASVRRGHAEQFGDPDRRRAAAHDDGQPRAVRERRPRGVAGHHRETCRRRCLDRFYLAHHEARRITSVWARLISRPATSGTVNLGRPSARHQGHFRAFGCNHGGRRACQITTPCARSGAAPHRRRQPAACLLHLRLRFGDGQPSTRGTDVPR